MMNHEQFISWESFTKNEADRLQFDEMSIQAAALYGYLLSLGSEGSITFNIARGTRFFNLETGEVESQTIISDIAIKGSIISPTLRHEKPYKPSQYFYSTTFLEGFQHHLVRTQLWLDRSRIIESRLLLSDVLQILASDKTLDHHHTAVLQRMREKRLKLNSHLTSPSVMQTKNFTN